MEQIEDHILFFDGHCTLCNSLVDWLMRRDQKMVLRFASLQGNTAKRILPPIVQQVSDFDTVIYWRRGEMHERSRAILLCLWDIGGIWKFVIIFMLIPRFLRDGIYRLVAKTRYRLFGRTDTCRLPKAHECHRILD